MKVRGGCAPVDSCENRHLADLPVAVDHWYRVVLHVRWTDDPAQALVEAWLVDGAQTRRFVGRSTSGYANIQTFYGIPTVQGEWPSYLKLGQYVLGIPRAPLLPTAANCGACNQESVVDYDEVMIGVSAGSIGFSVPP